ncbi:kinase-like domain-containing protein [Thelephora terrestris]|uniref:Kinase-like domain-containing protein n=1 Tax=Thelephora terrestris TaxID=56493 RepID=A0A9P6L236_9AGAM|nr:kinase-like domain-containing protein [Thelephora terrestris]
MTTSQVLQHLYALDTSSPDFSRCLFWLMRSDEEEKYLSSLRGPELIRLIDFLDEILDVAPTADDVFRRCLHKLQTICTHKTILPSSYTISGDLVRVGNDPVAFGGFSDVWEGSLDGDKVCIKHLRISEQVREAVEKAFYKEAIIWKRLRHPNVVAFIGVTRNPSQFVSKWMPNGTLTDYVNEKPGANRIGLLLDVAEGLNYLHANHTTHGDLKGPNILVDHSGHACVTDFGFASVVRGLNSVLISEVQGYTARWAAPEVLRNGDRNTQEADIFAYGMVVVEVFTGKCPFSEFTANVTISKIMDGERPDRPQDSGLTDPVWDLACTCWHPELTRRPTITKLVGIIRECYIPYAAGIHLSTPSPPRPMKKVAKARSPTVTYAAGIHLSTPSPPLPMKKVAKAKSPTVTMPLGFPSAYRRINEISGEIAKRKDGPNGERFTELLQLCTRWHAVPASYELGDVVKQGNRAQHVSRVTQIWKGMHYGEVVALKVFGLPQDDPDTNMAKERFCTAAVLLKQLKHKHILPFYGVSTATPDFCLVFPWYKNGNIERYLENNLGINRYNLVSGVVKGLLFLHSNGVVHGALRPSHVLIDNDGNARLTISPYDAINPHPPSTRRSSYWLPEAPKCISYVAPENRESSTMTTEGDMYGIAMVIYEVLTGIAPHWECRDQDSSFRVAEEGNPMRPPGAIEDRIWKPLRKCWKKDHSARPPIAEVCDALGFGSKITQTSRRRPPLRRPLAGGLPRTLELHVHSIKFSQDLESGQQFYVRFKYRNREFKTSPTNLKNDWGGHTWFAFCSFQLSLLSLSPTQERSGKLGDRYGSRI